MLYNIFFNLPNNSSGRLVLIGNKAQSGQATRPRTQGYDLHAQWYGWNYAQVSGAAKAPLFSHLMPQTLVKCFPRRDFH